MWFKKKKKLTDFSRPDEFLKPEGCEIVKIDRKTHYILLAPPEMVDDLKDCMFPPNFLAVLSNKVSIEQKRKFCKEIKKS